MKSNFLKALEKFHEPTTESINNELFISYMDSMVGKNRTLLGRMLIVYFLAGVLSLIVWHQKEFGFFNFALSNYFTFVGSHLLSFINGLVFSAVGFIAIPYFLHPIDYITFKQNVIRYSLILNFFMVIFVGLFNSDNLVMQVLWYFGSLIGSSYGASYHTLFKSKQPSSPPQ